MKKIMIFLLCCVLCVYGLFACRPDGGKKEPQRSASTFVLLCSEENRDLIPLLETYAKKQKIDLAVKYAASLSIPKQVRADKEKYDAIWSDNSIWNVGLSAVKNSRSIYVNPVIFAVTQQKYRELGLDSQVKLADIVGAVESGKLRFLMPSVTATNSGASAYLGFLNCLAGNPPVLTEEDLAKPALREALKSLFSGVQRNAGNEEYLLDVFMGGKFDAMVNYESALIALNQRLAQSGEPTLMFLYPIDGVSVSDSTFAYVDNGDAAKQKHFAELQAFLLSAETQTELERHGRRAGYGGLVSDTQIFRAEYGIDAKAYLSPIKYPAGAVIQSAMVLYQELLRKPSCTVFCLDYSGSMYGEGNGQLMAAMRTLLDYDLAAKDLIQFSEGDIAFALPFNDSLLSGTSASGSPQDTQKMYNFLNRLEPDGGTDMYVALEQAAKTLSEIDGDRYTRSIVLMTDGQSVGSLRDLSAPEAFPVFSIMFGDADPKQLDALSAASNGKTFDGRTNLVEAFQEIRAYN